MEAAVISRVEIGVEAVGGGEQVRVLPGRWREMVGDSGEIVGDRGRSREIVGDSGSTGEQVLVLQAGDGGR